MFGLLKISTEDGSEGKIISSNKHIESIFGIISN